MAVTTNKIICEKYPPLENIKLTEFLAFYAVACLAEILSMFASEHDEAAFNSWYKTALVPVLNKKYQHGSTLLIDCMEAKATFIKQAEKIKFENHEEPLKILPCSVGGWLLINLVGKDFAKQNMEIAEILGGLAERDGQEILRTLA